MSSGFATYRMRNEELEISWIEHGNGTYDVLDGNDRLLYSGADEKKLEEFKTAVKKGDVDGFRKLQRPLGPAEEWDLE